MALALASASAWSQQAVQTAPAQQSPVETNAADDGVVVLEKMVVTAQKREQQVQEVPIAITAFSGEFLDKLGIDGFERLGGYVPGLQTQVQSPNNPGFVIRGITSDSGDATVEPRVSVFQDGVSISRSRGAVVEMFDLERVEVLRGPQGTLFGRGAQTGAVHLIQNKARDATEGAFRAGFGNLGSTYFSGHVNAPLVDGTLFGRLAVFHEQRDGSVDNLAGGDLNGRDTQAVRASFHLNVGEASGIDLILNHQKDTPPGTAFRSNVIPTRAGTRDVFPDTPADLNRGEELGLDRTVNGATLLGDFWLSDSWTLSTITGWREFDSHEEFDADGSQLYLLEFAEIAKGRQTSQEVRFNYDGGGAFRGFFGGSWFDESGSQRVPFSTDERSLYALLSPTLSAATGGLLPVVSPLNPDATPNTSLSLINVHPVLQQLLGLPPFLPLKARHSEEYANFSDVSAYELFADGTWSLTDRFDLTLGVRYTHEEVESGYEALSHGTPSVLGLFLPTPANPSFPNALFAPTPGRVTGDGDFDSVVGRAVASHRFSDDINAYASVSRGRRPDVVQVDADGAQTIDEEIVWSYEIGLKGAANEGRFVYDLAAYYYDYSNFQTQVQNPTPPPFFIAANGGKAHASGVEVSLMNQFSDSLSGFFNYSWIDAGFNAFDDDGNHQALAGNRFRLTPENTVAVGLDWSVPFGNGRQFFLRPSYTWRSQVYFEDDNQPGIEQDAYGLLNLNTGIAFGNGWDVQVYAHNLTDEEYLVDAGNTGQLFGIPTYVPGTPRLYGIRFGYRFK
ncbi:TonB-dependent receptor [Aerolutibacter ruishenii]|uniref:TonB-dependent receptor n=1 Tax=Aerolutibacter ruishenii TaxID=686800 RepID=UPI0013159FBD|nr:TonB-dependent receptor [Lysobacter ruishenii]